MKFQDLAMVMCQHREELIIPTGAYTCPHYEDNRSDCRTCPGAAWWRETRDGPAIWPQPERLAARPYRCEDCGRWGKDSEFDRDAAGKRFPVCRACEEAKAT